LDYFDIRKRAEIINYFVIKVAILRELTISYYAADLLICLFVSAILSV